MADTHTQILSALTGALTESAILRPGSSEFENNNGAYFSAFEKEITPSFIAKPASAKEVQDLIRALRPYLLDGLVQVAVRGTGGTPFAGSANIQNGVTIDLRGLKGINVGEETVEVGSGETWKTVYTELEKHGLTTAGGRVGRVGVAGLALGGTLTRTKYKITLKLSRRQVGSPCSQAALVLSATPSWSLRLFSHLETWSGQVRKTTQTSGLLSGAV